MSEKKQRYLTVRIPGVYEDLILKYIEAHKEEMLLLGQKLSRAAIVTRALYEFLKKEGIIQSK